MDIFLFLYLVGVYQGTVTASLPGAFLPGLFPSSDFVLKVMVPLPTTAFQLSCRYPMQDHQNASIRVSFFTAVKKDVYGNYTGWPTSTSTVEEELLKTRQNGVDNK